VPDRRRVEEGHLGPDRDAGHRRLERADVHPDDGRAAVGVDGARHVGVAAATRERSRHGRRTGDEQQAERGDGREKREDGA
jgi:hypothetical protein